MVSDEAVVVLGAGPAGLGVAYELANRQVPVIVLEREDSVGGICRTVRGNGYTVDVGGHRLITKMDEVLSTWKRLLGEDLLVRERRTRIFLRGRLMPYPLRIASTCRTLGLSESLLAVFSYLAAGLHPLPDDSFENWVTNRFGRRVYQHFFRTYTEKVWGTPCSELSADWAAQRIRSFSLLDAMKDAVRGAFQPDLEADDESLLASFHYPRLGPGMLFEAYADAIAAGSGQVLTGREVVRIIREGNRIREVLTSGAGAKEHHAGGSFLSSLPLAQLPLLIAPPPPAEVLQAARALRHRSFVSVALLLDQPCALPDTWIYVHEPGVRMGRVQNYLNWSPELVEREGHSCIAAEYFAWQEDPLWTASDAEMTDLAVRELSDLGLIEPRSVVGATVTRVSHAYPIYDPGYRERVDTVRSWVESIGNLQTIGRSGQHRYINLDFAIMTGIQAARNLNGANHDTWLVGTEEQYLEDRPS
ncbi:MAG TPA: FAD-dependent oxidoreductase [Armatimonadetes bacterium]|nr:FAD-dependent oxidoreductase [Armatimonadota bacterium]